MKKLLYILFFFAITTVAYSQDDQPGADKLKEKMVEYIQIKLSLNKAEAERFQPVFLDYLRDLRKVNGDHRGDKLRLQKEIIDLRLRYRDEFKPIVGEKRSNEVFQHEREFVQTLKEVRKERIQERRNNRVNQRNSSKL